MGILGKGYDLETYSLETLKSGMFAIAMPVEFFVRFTVINEVICVIVKFDISGGIALGIPCEPISIPRSALVGGSNDSDIFRGIRLVPIEFEKSELSIIVVPSKIVSYRTTVIIFVDIGSYPGRSCTGRKPNLTVIGTGRDGGLWGEIQAHYIERIGDYYAGKTECKNTRQECSITRKDVVSSPKI